jgi:DMSO reductase family type II enzyme chaperone
MSIHQDADVSGENTSVEEISKVYRVLGWCFSYPESELYESLTQEDLGEEIKELVNRLPFQMAIHPFRVVRSQEELETLYTTCFDMPLCPIPFQETIFRKGEVSREDVQEGVVRFYEHFGLELKSDERDFPDHLVAELEFMAFLSAKEANALAHQKDATPYRLAQRDFLARHLCKWFRRMNQKIQNLIDEPYYKNLGNFTKEFLDAHLIYLRNQVRDLKVNGEVVEQLADGM